MGNDGGSIPKRRELVKNAARAPSVSELKASALESLSHAWSHCPLSAEPLDRSNAVSDSRGRLYNYESILRALVPPVGASCGVKQSAGPAASPLDDESAALFASTGIKSLRDVVKLQFHRPTSSSDVYVCPLSQKELGASTRCVYIVPCGHVFSDAGLRTVASAADEEQEKTSTSTGATITTTTTTTSTTSTTSTSATTFSSSRAAACPQCSTEFLYRDVIPILPTEEKDVRRLERRMEALRAEGFAHTLKKDKTTMKQKKNKKRKAPDIDESAIVAREVEKPLVKKPKNPDMLKTTTTPCLAAKAVAPLEASSSNRKSTNLT